MTAADIQEKNRQLSDPARVVDARTPVSRARTKGMDQKAAVEFRAMYPRDDQTAGWLPIPGDRDDDGCA